MKILHSLEEVCFNENSAVTVGKFDGLHTGHDFLVGKILKKKVEGLLAVVITFDFNPGMVIFGANEKYLMTKEEKRMLFEQQKVDYLVELPFDETLMRMEAKDFIEKLCQKLHMKYIAAGSDFRFGYQGRGDVTFLRKLSKTMDFEVDIFSKLEQDHRVISSTFVREEIAKGHIPHANQLLGYPYYIIGSVSHGNKIGSTKIGRPTINIFPPKEKLLPPNGVYITEVVCDGALFPSVTNIGNRPTINEIEKKVSVETHIFDFVKDVYGQQVKILFKDFLRPEKKFESLSELKAQIEADIQTTYAYFGLKSAKK